MHYRQLSLSSHHILRFQRWSRSRAAAFHSVGNVVNIGRLRANVQEQIAPKSSHSLLLISTLVVEQSEGSGKRCERQLYPPLPIAIAMLPEGEERPAALPS